jgi:hypothetical protein
MDMQNPEKYLGPTPSDSPSSPSQPGELAPIALFVYNRPEHARRTVESLRANHLAQQSDLFVFADAAKDESAVNAVEAVRKFTRTIEGFRSVTVIERERNCGLAGSVIQGVTRLCEEFGRVIVIEDDLLTAPDFLVFMNSALERYVDDPWVFSVSGFNYAVKTPEDYPYDAFFAYRSSSWGWGTWKDRWAKADWSVSDYARFRSDKGMQRLFNRGGDDLSRMLALQMAGDLDSWAIRWAYTHWKHDAFAVLPTQSRIFNIGLDGSGVHCRPGSAKQSPLKPGGKFEIRFPSKVDSDPRFAAQISHMHRVSPARRCARFLLRAIKGGRKHSGSAHQAQIAVPPCADKSHASR